MSGAKMQQLHPAYTSVENVVSAFTDDNQRAALRTHLIVSQLFDDGMLKDAARVGGSIVLVTDE